MLTVVQELVLETLQITILVAVMMILVDLLNVWTKRRVASFFQEKTTLRQYVSPH